jgi:hypothetical protein
MIHKGKSIQCETNLRLSMKEVGGPSFILIVFNVATRLC